MLAAIGLMAAPVTAARANATWTGASTAAAPANTYWSDSGNWTGSAPAANASAGTLTFPTLTCSTCAYTSNDNLPGVNAVGLVFSNTSGSYQILGDSLTVGSGGISDTAGGGTGTAINAPVVLSSPQTWSVGSAGANGYNVLTLLGGVTGAASDGLTVTFPSVPEADLFVDSDMEVGPVTVNGAGALHVGGPTWPGSVNGTDDQPVSLNGATLVANPGSTTGPLTVTGGALLLGTNPQNNGTTTLHVDGAATLSSSTATRTFINNNGPTPGTDFSQLSAAGSITLDGRLVVGQGPAGGSCATLSPGDTATLITTTGTIVGTFANAPEGEVLTLTSSCPGPAPQAEIHYTSNTVTATVIGPPAPPPPAPPGSVPPPQRSRPKRSRGRLLGPRGRLRVARHAIRVRQKCDSSRPCQGRFSLTTKVRRRKRGRNTLVTVACASARFRIGPHRTTTSTASVRGTCMRLLRSKHHHHRLTVTYAPRPVSGQAARNSRITLLLR